jgi:CubicO group peptidase (beta-lactamase class C family)
MFRAAVDAILREPRLTRPKRDVTTRMLMLHTSGAGYHCFDASLKRLAEMLAFGHCAAPCFGLSCSAALATRHSAEPLVNGGDASPSPVCGRRRREAPDEHL